MATTSPDPRVQALAAKRALLCEQIEHADAILAVYARTHDTESSAGKSWPAVGPLRHYGMTDRSACGCDVCAEWRRRQDELVAALRFVPEGHKWSVCACPDCRFVGRIQLNYVAASNVRDLLIEMSYHANFHSPHGVAVMSWLDQELQSPRYTIDWCAYEIGRRPVDEWLTRCETELSPVVSGIVFKPGSGEYEELFVPRPAA